YNAYHDLSSGNSPVAPAKQIAPEPGWTAISAGDDAICGIRDGNAYCWGTSQFGVLGDGVWASQHLPTQPVMLGPADDISVGKKSPDNGGESEELACARTGTQIKCWGQNTYGATGTGQAASSSAPVAVASPTGAPWKHVWASNDHNCAQTDDGALYCWGADY